MSAFDFPARFESLGLLSPILYLHNEVLLLACLDCFLDCAFGLGSLSDTLEVVEESGTVGEREED